LQIDRFSINATIGSTKIPEPMLEVISKNPISVPLLPEMLNFGNWNAGKPDGIFPRT